MDIFYRQASLMSYPLNNLQCKCVKNSFAPTDRHFAVPSFKINCTYL